MTTETADIIKLALELPLLDRAQVVDELQRSMAPPLDPAFEAALVEEMDRRWQEVESGEAELFDQEQVLAEAKARYGW